MLADMPEIVALTKVDSVDAATLKQQTERLRRVCGHTPIKLSAVTGLHMRETLANLLTIIDQAKAKAVKEAAPAESWTP